MDINLFSFSVLWSLNKEKCRLILDYDAHSRDEQAHSGAIDSHVGTMEAHSEAMEVQQLSTFQSFQNGDSVKTRTKFKIASGHVHWDQNKSFNEKTGVKILVGLSL
jgi:hypothetical protein